MLARSHVVVAFGCVVAYKAALGDDLTINPLDYIVAVFASLLPDIDDNRSYIGSRFAFIAFPFRMIFGHRGITHSLLMLAILSGLVFFYGNEFNWIIPFAIGYGSHLLADFVTNSGIPLFYPYSQRYKFFVTFETGSIKEYVVVFVLSLGITIFVLQYQGAYLAGLVAVENPELYKKWIIFLGKLTENANLIS